MAAPAVLPAQWGVWRADSLLAAGQIASAEAAYYAAARAKPRDPVARAALGHYLAARGATKVGAVLIEEAMFFGGDSSTLGRTLVPLYARLNDYDALLKLRPEVMTPSERRRALWLADHEPTATLPDSIAISTYRPLADGSGIGTVLVRLGAAEFPAVIDPRVAGLHVPPAARRQLREFGVEGGRVVASAPNVRIGGLRFSNVPATIGAPDDPVRIGLDVLAPYAPTFDPASGTITLRRVDRRAAATAGVRVPLLYDATGLRLLLGGRWQPTTLAAPGLLLGTRKWMLDVKRGDVVLLDGR